MRLDKQHFAGVYETSGEKDPDVLIATKELARAKRPKQSARSVKKPAPSENSKFMHLMQVLEVVPVSRSTLYTMVATGKFPKPLKIGGRLSFWDKLEVNAWIEKKLSR